jgi:glyoxylase-like metal-dependent hydrolase (beta-lactamase superfamily II)
MAFQKPIEIGNTGLVAAYWRLTHCQLDHEAGIAEFRLHGYPDREARVAGKAPLPIIAYRLTPAELGQDGLHSLTTAQLYAAARSQPAVDAVVWFADAADC